MLRVVNSHVCGRLRGLSWWRELLMATGWNAVCMGPWSYMMKRFGWLVVLLFLLGGCRSAIGYTSTGGVYQVPTRALWFDSNARMAAHWEAENDHAGRGTVYSVSSVAPVPPSRSKATSDEQQTPLRAFDPIAARSALSAVNVSDCKASRTSPRIHGHAQVVFSPDGTVTKVTIDTPAGLHADQVKCVGDRLGATKVDAFKGSVVTMGTTFVL